MKLNTEVVQPGIIINEGGGDNGDTRVSAPCFTSLIDHWAKARIDGPVQTIARYDDAAKQIITLGGVLQSLLVAAYAIVRPAETVSLASLFQQPTTWLFLLYLAAFLWFFVCVIMSCQQRLKMKGDAGTDVYDVHTLIQHAAEGCLLPGEVSAAVKNWCVRVDRLIEYKHKWIQQACISLGFSSFLMMLLLFFAIMRIKLS